MSRVYFHAHDVATDFVSQTLCKKILRKHSAYHSALLADPPKDIQLEIGVVLDKCAAPGSAHISRVLLQELRTLLERSLHF